MPEIKLPAKELILFAFIGGIVLSLLELANMLASHQNIFDLYFWGGMIIAGLIGVIGLLLSQTKDIGGAITAGIAAPQLLGGITNIAPTVVTFLFNSIVTPVYAQTDTTQMMENDSIEIVIVLKGSNEILELSTQQYTNFIKDTTIMKIHKDEQLSISGKNVDDIKINFEDELNRVANDTAKQYIVNVNVVEYVSQQNQQVQNKNSFLRGVLGHKYRKKPQVKHKLEVKIECDTTRSED